MQDFISWFEIPATDFKRAVSFYQEIFDIKIKETELFGSQMGFFPSNDENVSGAIVKGDDYQPASNGVVLYLNGGNDLQPILDKVKKVNGTIVVPKTQISEEIGFFAMFIDSEGNKLALHSKK